MIELIRFPKISANIEEATLTTWIKDENENVAKDDVIAEITTDKGIVEFESPAAGVLLQKIAPENSTVPVGYIIAIIGAPGDDLPDVAEENQKILHDHRQKDEPRDMPQRSVNKRSRQRVRATPAARRLARRNNIELHDVKQKLGIEVVDETSIRQYLEA